MGAHPDWRPPRLARRAIGLLGAFTTFSTFSNEIVHLLASGAWGRAAMYAVGSLLLGLTAVWVGLSVGGKIVA